ncbi:MAG: histidine kinase [Crocinitomicaceae bacterium]
MKEPAFSDLLSTELLVDTVQKLSLARDIKTVMRIVRSVARELTGADGATFVLRDDNLCYYADEDAIKPLWKGSRFPMESCISGWAMLNKKPAVIKDIYEDNRIPLDAYKKTFVKSLVTVPIRTVDPIGAIGNYWAKQRQPSEREVALLQALANVTAVAIENIEVRNKLEEKHKLVLTYHARSLSSQLNPHFIFNVLNSIQYYILENKQLLGLEYLTSFASLMRMTLDNSRLDYITIEDEVKFLTRYIELESSRFENKFKYVIEVSDEINEEDVLLPPMIIQPYVENAIMHGVANRTENGELSVKFSREDSKLFCRVKDNGVGREKSAEINAASTDKKHKSAGMELIGSRLKLLQEIEKGEYNTSVNDIIDKNGKLAGTEVVIEMPINEDV